MTEILSFDKFKKVKGDNPLKKLWGFYSSQPKFIKFTIIIFALIILVTPIIITTYQIYRSKAQVTLNLPGPTPSPSKSVSVLSLSYLPTAPCNNPASKIDLTAATATSTNYNDWSTVPQNAIDGNIDSTMWMLKTPYKGSYLTIDLSQVQSTKALSLYFWSGDRPESYHIDVSSTGSFAGEETRIVTENAGLSGYYVYKTGSAINRKDYFFNQISARYVRFTIDAYRNDTTLEEGQINMYEFELYADSQQKSCLDTTITGDVHINSNASMDDPLSEIRTRINDYSLKLSQTLKEGSRYHGYKTATATSYLSYSIYEHKEFLQPIPISTTYSRRPDYMSILNNINICNYVDNLGVKDVWIWSYHTDKVEPEESDMAMGALSKNLWNQTNKFDVYPGARYGDISNSSQTPDLPVCNRTYVLYNFNYETGVNNLVHNYIHQIENELAYQNREMFWDMYVGRQYSFSGPRRCGHSHTAPNGASDYDYANQTFKSSDCEDWQPVNCINNKPDAACGGVRKSINCSQWNCDELQYYIWWMQNLPGENNNLTYNGANLRNWWDFMVDFDTAIAQGKSLTLGTSPSPSPSPTSPPVQNYGTVTGTVYSSAGGIVPEAKITIKIGKTNKSYYSDALGIYSVTNLPAGTYSLTFQLKGYVNQTVSATVTANTTATKNVTLVKR